MEYCSTVWDSYNKTHSDTLEKVQRRAATWVTGRFHNMSSPSAMIQDMGWRDLNQRRADSRLCMLYKISQGPVDIPIGQFLRYNRDGVHFQTIYARTKYYEFSFCPPYCRWLERTSQWHSFGSKFGSVQTEHCHHYPCHALGPLITIPLLLLSFTVTNSFIFIFIFSFPLTISFKGT